VPLALPGDDVTPEKFVTFWCDGSRGLYIRPNVWHAAFVPLDDQAEFLDRQGRVHARVSVDFVKEFGWYLGAPLRRPTTDCWSESGRSRDRIISAMRTSGPTTRSAHTFSHFIKTDLYAAVPGLIFLSGCDPAYPLIAC
jgi:hypothetical protein